MGDEKFQVKVLQEGECVTCGRSDVEHYASMRCKNCYYRQQRVDKKLEKTSK